MLESCGARGVGVTSLAITVNEEKVTVGKDPLGWRRRVANGRHAHGLSVEGIENSFV
jgi:hypothetical protein